ncbi:virulence factor TspB C-terminal domain-related protein [Comamonas aquatica]|uniref:virulence factor TspB C-terminal domain-related protein n=1 Tax=Comamonas aquatica TaxID=225991 RepID=UPI002447B5D4|nr:virulence factor TspB C-terminal domain-related protein [Comamonas aquatica]MDH1816119.1 virulence factor TspB C-terminal domain-related protein [Comamonas aquatica]
MDHHFKGLIAALALSAGSAFAGYAQATPPVGWSAGGGAGGAFTGTKAANGATFLSGSVSTNASLNVGGRAVSMPATMRFAANAPRVAAAAVMLHPGIRTVAQIAGWLGLASLVYDEASGLWSVPDTTAQQSDGLEYFIQYYPGYYPSASAACSASLPHVQANNSSSTVTLVGVVGTQCRYTIIDRWGNSSNAANNIYNRNSSCPSGWYVTAAGCVQTPQPKTVTQEEAVEELTKHPMPADVPRHIPTPLPVEQPTIQPTFIPTGDPITNPKFNPSEAPSPSNPPQVQPGVEVKPAPTPGSPWQVDTIPVNRPVEDPSAPPSREPQPLPDTGGGPSGNEPKDPDKTDFCEKYPTVIACQELKHEDDDTKLPEKAIEFDFNPLPGFQGVKSCPSFPNIGNALGGRQISWQPFCDQLSKIANLILALAWFSAAWILFNSRSN